MTDTIISYNPILTRTEFMVNGEEIAKTSNLYRYRNTPIEDWIDVFVPELVEYCNDDRISIEIRSLQKYIDDIKNRIDDYCAMHRVVIDVQDVSSIGYKGRMNKINNILNELGDVSLLSAESEDLTIVVASSAEQEDYEEFLKIFLDSEDFSAEKGLYVSELLVGNEFDKLEIKIPSISDRNIKVKLLLFPNLIECDNSYWLSLKEILSDEKDYMFIGVLNSDSSQNDELIDYIAEQYDRKGRLNRSRFLLLSSNPRENMNYLRDEYGMKVAQIIDIDEASECHEAIQYYIQNICYPKKISWMYSRIKNVLETMQSANFVEVIENQKIIFEKQCEKIKEHYKSIVLRYIPIEELLVDKFLEMFAQKTAELVVKKGKQRLKNRFGLPGLITMHTLTVDKFPDDKLSADISIIAEDTLYDLLVEHYKANAEMKTVETILDFGGKFAISYNVVSVFEKELMEQCVEFVSSMSQIEKKSGTGSKIKFFEWVIENISVYDVSMSSYSRTEIEKKIKRRISAIKTQVKELFDSINETTCKILEEKIDNIELLTQESCKRFKCKCNEFEKQYEVSGGNRNSIKNISELVDDINAVIEL